MEAVFFIMIFFLGAAVFSFIYVLVCRIPVRLGDEKTFAGYPLIPLFGGCFAVLSVYWFGQSGAYSVRGGLQAVLVFVLLAILTVVSFLDVRLLKIPKELTAAVFICGIAAAVLFPEQGLLSRVIGVFAVSLPMAGLACGISGAFGGGDIKLMAAAGLFLGWRGILAAFFVSLISAAVYCIYLLLSGKKGRKGRFAFGPFLCVGIAAAAFWGEMMVQWYQSI